MTSEQLASAWSAPSNRMTFTEAASLTSAVLNEIRARRRRSSLGLAVIAAAFAALTFAKRRCRAQPGRPAPQARDHVLGDERLDLVGLDRCPHKAHL